MNQDLDAASERLGNTPQQAANMLRLARYLEKLPEDYEEFDMGEFGHCMVSEPCDTPACAAGHGPGAGMPRLTVPFGQHQTMVPEAWSDYTRRVFGLSVQSDDFCFSGGWVDVDNTPAGAAARLRFMLAEGPVRRIPDGREWWNPEMYAEFSRTASRQSGLAKGVGGG